MRSMAWCVGNLGKGGEYAEREGRMGGGAWVVGVGQAGQAGEEVEGMESGSMGQGGSRRSWKGGGRSGPGGGEPWGQEPWVHDKHGRRGSAGWGWGLGVGVEQGPETGPALAAMQVEG